jgi:hypothetical protein
MYDYASRVVQGMLIENRRPSSPFWRTRSATPQLNAGKSTKVIGASYSHADMLKFDSL